MGSEQTGSFESKSSFELPWGLREQFPSLEALATWARVVRGSQPPRSLKTKPEMLGNEMLSWQQALLHEKFALQTSSFPQALPADGEKKVGLLFLCQF